MTYAKNPLQSLDVFSYCFIILDCNISFLEIIILLKDLDFTPAWGWLHQHLTNEVMNVVHVLTDQPAFDTCEAGSNRNRFNPV